MFEQIRTIRKALLTALLAGAAHTAPADITVSVEEVGNDVAWNASGSADISGLVFSESGTAIPTVTPGVVFVIGTTGSGDAYSMSGASFAGPGSIGSGARSDADSATGDVCGLDFQNQVLLVPAGYISGDPVSSTATYANQTLASLGLTEGVYTWTWNTASGAESLTLEIIGPPPVVANATQGTSHLTLQDALDNANSGDAIEIGAGTLFEDNIVFPSDLSVTVTGAGMDQTFIDGGGASNPENAILMVVAPFNGVDQTVTISDLTLQNGNASGNPGGVSVGTGFDAEFTRVAFRQNTGTVGAHALINSPGTFVTMRDCVFTGGSGFDTIFVGAESLLLTNCLFYDNNTTDSAIWLQSNAAVPSPMATVTNCTIDQPTNSAAHANGTSARVDLVNSVLVGAFTGDGVIATSHCLSTSVASGSGNIVGTPTFVDAVNGDYRLAPGTLGIDAADSNAYITAQGGLTDLAGSARTNNDSGTPDTGTGPFASLDMGAYEFQGQSPGNSCVADVTTDGTSNGVPDGSVTLSDFSYYLGLWSQGCP